MSDSGEKSRERCFGLAEESYDLDPPESKGRYRSSPSPSRSKNAKNIWHSRFIEFFEFSPIPFVALNGSHIWEVNVAACELFSKSIAKIQKKNFKNFFENPDAIDVFLKGLNEESATQQSIHKLLSGEKVRLYAVKSVEPGDMVRIGLTLENADPRDIQRLRHVLLAAKEAIAIYNNSELIFSNKASRVLLREYDTKNLEYLLQSVGISENFEEINASLENKNLWKRPVSLAGNPYRLTLSRIFYEDLSEREYVIQLSPFTLGEQSQRYDRGLHVIPDLALTPLTVIKSSASLLADISRDGESFQKILGLLQENVAFLCRVMENTTTVEDHQRGGIPIVSVLSASVQFIRQARDFDIELEIQNPGLKICANEQKAIQAFIALFLLSLKFTDKNQIRISVSESPEHLIFKIYVIDLLEECPELCLKGIQRTLHPIGADVGIFDDEGFYIKARFLRSKN